MLSGVQHQYAALGCSRRLHIVAPITDPDTIPVVNHVLHDFGAAKHRLLRADPDARDFSRISTQVNPQLLDAPLPPDPKKPGAFFGCASRA